MNTEKDWFIQEIRKLPVKKQIKLISEWAEKRFMTSDVTSHTGKWDNKYAPYTVEIMNNLAPDSGITEVAWMKGSQTAGTVAVLENWMGYIIDEAPAPTMYLTASDEVAKVSSEIYLQRMIESAGLEEKIKTRGLKGKTGRRGFTTNRVEFPGGFILIYGAQSPNTYLRVSVQNLAIDEVSSLPTHLRGKPIDPVELALGRQKGFERTRKTLYLGVPEYHYGTIHKIFLDGDQRYYYIPCRFCGYEQTLIFRGTREDGKKYGIYFEFDDKNKLIAESIHYRCFNCLKLLKNIDKHDFLNAGFWKSTQKSKRKGLRTYQLSSLYAPEGAYSWERLVDDYLKTWDPVAKRTIDVEKLKTFVTSVQGLPFEDRTEAPRFERIISHRRPFYARNEIKNKIIIQETGSPILLLTAGVDVHKRWLGIEIKGWADQARSYSIDYRQIRGDGENWQSKAWLKLQDIIENESWTADDGKIYNLKLTLIDASYATDTVYTFCFQYQSGVYAVQGRETGVQHAAHEGFNEYVKKGLTAYNVNTGRYKDRLASKLSRDWNTDELQPWGYPNFPVDYGDDFFREYEAESKVKKVYPSGKQNFVWKKKNENEPNHAWDCGVYNEAALEMLCHQINFYFFGKDEINWALFWEYIKTEKIFYTEPQNIKENEPVLAGQDN